MRKVDLGERIANEIDPTIRVDKIFKSLCSQEAFDAVKEADYVFGCVDNDGARLVQNESCSAYSTLYLDIASDVNLGPPLAFGGRVCVSWNKNGCMVCLGLLDSNLA